MVINVAHLDIPDTPVDWYDFGGGWTVTTTLPKDAELGENMAALCCVRNNKFHYKMIYGDFYTAEDLAAIRPTIEPEFLDYLKLQDEGGDNGPR